MIVERYVEHVDTQYVDKPVYIERVIEEEVEEIIEK